MKSNPPICVIGGYDILSKSFFYEVRTKNTKSIFINLNGKKINKLNVFNFKIFELKKILTLLKKNNIKNLLFLGKINRPSLEDFVLDGEIDKYISKFTQSFKKGDGSILSSVLEIFTRKGFNILTPQSISKKYFFQKSELCNILGKNNKLDRNKSIKILNDLSKYDNAQSIVIINGYIIAIEGVEGTDELLKRVFSIRKRLGQIHIKAGLLTKIPKKSQSKLIDLPVIGVKTLKLIDRANLDGIAINPKLTIVNNKEKFLKYAYENNLKIYSTT
jgi:DUF1009 family protein